jgi:hypothetical protein
MRVTFTLTFVTISVICHCESRSVRDAIARVLSIVRSECGARGRTDTRRTRAASGIMQAGITTGRWGAATGLGQVWAGNARNNCARCCLRKGERHRSAFLPRPRKPGLKSQLGDGILPQREPRWNADRRTAPSFILPRMRGRIWRGAAAVPAARQVGASVCRRSASLLIWCCFLSSLPGLTRQSKRQRSAVGLIGRTSQAASQHGSPDQVRW